MSEFVSDGEIYEQLMSRSDLLSQTAAHAILVLRTACHHAETVMMIVQPRSDTAEYLETLAELRAAMKVSA